MRAPAMSITSPEIPALRDELAAFPASRIDDALARLMAWLQEHFDVEDVVWLGSVLMLDAAAAGTDPALGWRLRARRRLLPETEAHRQLFASYFSGQHFGRLTPGYFSSKPGPDADVHVGATSRALVEGAGKFRAYRLRDGWVDFARFRRTEHYRLYYTNLGIADRIWVAAPLSAQTESVFLLDRHHRPGGRRKLFTNHDTALAAAVLGGQREFHRRLLLSNGVLRGVKALSPLKRRILLNLLTGRSDKEIAGLVELRPLTLRKYITELYGEYGVKTRAALMGLWLGEG